MSDSEFNFKNGVRVIKFGPGIGFTILSDTMNTCLLDIAGIMRRDIVGNEATCIMSSIEQVVNVISTEEEHFAFVCWVQEQTEAE